MNGTKIDMIKALYTYSVAAIVIVGGGAALVFVPLADNTALVMAGFIGSAMTFLFGLETATRTARQSAAATAAATNGHSKPSTGTDASGGTVPGAH